MNNKKGFTMIELLAVVVILAAIALIVTPLILSMVVEAKKQGFENSAYRLIKAGEIGYSDEELLTGETISTSFTYTDGVETSIPKGRSLDYKGLKPKSGTVVVNNEGEIAIAIHNGTYCAEKTFDQGEVTLSEKTAAECYVPYFADLSGVSVPELAKNMIPIKWDGTKWIKADINNLIGDNQWYNYNNKEWANAVLVSESSRVGYVSAVAGTPVAELDIMAYLVWVPRYKYKLFNVAASSVTTRQIDVIFETTTVAKSAGTANGDYLTHPAFTFGSEELEGFWVGKFETTGDANVPQVRPGVLSLVNQSANTQFLTAQKFNTTTTYGLTVANDAHMMKNMEWGAVAYLSHSIYGKNSELWNNPSSTFVTGCGGTSGATLSVATCDAYDTANGQLASTTGNIYGIYDMSGGAYDRVMGAMNVLDESVVMVASSGFSTATISGLSMAKYIDRYSYSITINDQASFNRRKLGDATGEVRSWYGDRAYMTAYTTSSYCWFLRGYAGTTTSPTYEGPFSFYYNTGSASTSVSFRLVALGD